VYTEISPGTKEGDSTNEKKIAATVDVWAALHREELVRDISRLIAVKSVCDYGGDGYPMGKGCHEAAEYMTELGRQYGFHSEHDDYCVSILHPGTEGKHELGLLCHLDVVPEGSGWKHDPWQAVEKDGWLIGRGSADNKGPAVTALYVLRCMKELGLALKSDLRLIAGCDEENDMRDVQHYLAQHEAPAYTLNCDGAWAACIGEKGIFAADLIQRIEDGSLIAIGGGSASNTVPDSAYAVLPHASEEALEKTKQLCPDVQLERQEEGVLLRVKGKSAHCFVPHLGENAIVRLIRLLCEADLLTGEAAIALARLRQCFADDYGTGLRIQHEDSISGKTTCVPSLIRFCKGELRQHINVRYALTQKGAFLQKSLEKRLAKLHIAHEVLEHTPPRYDPADDPIVSMLIENCQTHLGRQHKPYVMGGGTHSRLFPRSIPYGPGVMDPRVRNSFGDPHGPEEAVCIEQLIQAVKVYVIALLKLDERFYASIS